MKEIKYTDPNYIEVGNTIERLSYKMCPNDSDLRYDYQQEAWLDFYRRLPEYDNTKASLNTFAYRVAWGAMQHYRRNNVDMIRKPGWVQEIQDSYKNLADHENNDDLLREHAAKRNIPLESVKNALKYNPKVGSYSQETIEHETQDSSTNFHDTIDNIDAIRNYISQLNEKEKQVLYYRYFQENNKTVTAKLMGISVNYVCYLERKAIDKIRRLAQRAE